MFVGTLLLFGLANAQPLAFIGEYVMAGGTIVALGHTRKSPKADGSPQYQGTTDILEDFDAVYVAELMSDDGRTDRRIVRLNMEKKRADSPNVVAYSRSARCAGLMAR